MMVNLIKEKVLKKVKEHALNSKEQFKRVVEELLMENNLIDEAINLTLQEGKKSVIEFNSTDGVWLDPEIQRKAFAKLLKDFER